MVNQFQILDWIKRNDCHLWHIDAPFHFTHWNKSTNSAGFSAIDETMLSGMPSPATGQQFDGVYRIYSPTDLRPSQWSDSLVVFAVTELGLDTDSFVSGCEINDFESRGGRIVTPSRWSRDRIIDFGFNPDCVKVVPHAASSTYFNQFPHEVRLQQRLSLGFAPEETVLLNIGAAIWNKGIDILIKAFALARQKRKDLRLLFKDQRHTYGIAGDQYVHATLAGSGLLSDDVVRAITLIPSNLTMEQMASMYNLVDAYVSPYRAEGFNLPVCEAMACGTPVVVTEGGATDDFVVGNQHHKIHSTRFDHVQVQSKLISAYCEPDLDHLVEILLQLPPKSEHSQAVTSSSTATGWSAPVSMLARMF